MAGMESWITIEVNVLALHHVKTLYKKDRFKNQTVLKTVFKNSIILSYTLSTLHKIKVFQLPTSGQSLPVLLQVLRSAHGTVSMKHSQDRSCGRTLRKKDLRRAHHRYQRAA